MRRSEMISFLFIVAVAVFFRFYHLHSVPPGLYPDEAMNGNNAIQALETGGYKVFYTENNGREGLFINLQAQSIRLFGNTAFALRFVSAVAGILTVAGLYFLTRILFNRQIAMIAAFLLAVSFWHVLFSRIGFRAILAPLFLVWGLYFFWRGLRNVNMADFAVSGVFWGLGFYTYIAFRIMPLLIAVIIVAHWFKIYKDYAHDKYAHMRRMLLYDLLAFAITAAAVSAPLAYYFWHNPGDFMGRTGQLSVFSAEHPIRQLFTNSIQTLAMFNFAGDRNWRHNFSGDPELFWPIGALFAVGFIKSCLKLFKIRKEHGHISAVQLLLLVWFFLALAPVIISNEGLPHALRAILAAPVVYIFAAEGLWWLFEIMDKWYRLRDVYWMRPQLGFQHMHESTAAAAVAVTIFLLAVGTAEYNKYFNLWAPNPQTAAAFNANYTATAQKINLISRAKPVYVYINAAGVPVNSPGLSDGIPMPAQTVMYLTDTWTAAKQNTKNIRYLTESQYQNHQYPYNAIIVPLEK